MSTDGAQEAFESTQAAQDKACADGHLPDSRCVPSAGFSDFQRCYCILALRGEVYAPRHWPSLVPAHRSCKAGIDAMAFSGD